MQIVIHKAGINMQSRKKLNLIYSFVGAGEHKGLWSVSEEGPGVCRGGSREAGVKSKTGKGGSRYMCLGTLGCQDFLAAERVLTVVDGVSQFLQHHIQGGVLGQFHHEHAGLHANVA